MSRGAWRDEESIITCLKGKGTPEDPELFGRGLGGFKDTFQSFIPV